MVLLSRAGNKDEYMNGIEENYRNDSSVDISSADRRIWLVKMPDFVYNKIIELEGEEDVDVGVVRIYPAVGDFPVRVMIKLDEEGPCGSIPLEYELKIARSQHQIHMFSENELNEAISIDGKVEQECQMRPILSQDYRQVLHNRTKEANKPARTVQYVDPFASSVALGLPKYVKENVLIERFNRRGTNDLRRERLPHDELINLLFHQFERQPHWTLQQLIDYTHQPVQYLKEVLSEIALYNTRGPFKNLYELKPEFVKGVAYGGDYNEK